MRNNRHANLHRAFERAPALACAVVAVAAASPALAVPCNELNLPNPIYGTGGSAVTATLRRVAVKLAGLANPITVLYSDTLSACPGYEEFLDNEITPTTIRYWDASNTERTCEPPTTGVQTADFAHMGNPASFCPGARHTNGVPAGVGDFPAPIQTLNIVTSAQSTQNSISAEALHFIYGFGANSGVAPWTVEAALSSRQPGAFISLFVADGLPLNPTQFIGERFNTQNLLIDEIADDALTISPDATLGFVSGSAADAQRRGTATPKIKTLAFQYIGQTRAYYPDSTASSFDKLNVRKGQYHYWAPGHFFARVDSSGTPTNALVAQLIGWFSATIDGPAGLSTEDILKEIITAGDVPVCATEVFREGLSGAITSFAPNTPCQGFFEFTTTGATSRTACPNRTECTGGSVCRFGYCEAY